MCKGRESFGTLAPIQKRCQIHSASDDDVLTTDAPIRKPMPPSLTVTRPCTPAFTDCNYLGIGDRSPTLDCQKDPAELDVLVRLGRNYDDFEEVKCLGLNSAVYENMLVKACMSVLEVGKLRFERKERNIMERVMKKQWME